MPFPENLRERRRRAWIYGALVAAVLLLLTVRLFHLQIVRGESYVELARENMVRSEPIPALRGCIYDRHGRLLAGNRASFNLSLEAGHPFYADRDHLRSAVAEAARILGRDPAELEQRALRYRTMFEPLLLARDLDQALLAPFVERLHPIAGITIDQVPLRWNPHGALAAHALGHVGEISEEELQEAEKGVYRRGQLVGRSGLERQYETLLRGLDGETYVKVDALGRKIDLFPDLPPSEPRPGADLHLTLDARLQRVAEVALQQAPRESGADEALRGAVVALDPLTGELLVCASAPTFDPNAFAHGLTTEQWAALNVAAHPLLNRVTQAGYPPGSIFKIATTLAGLDGQVITPDTALGPCYGSYTFGNRSFRCWKAEGHGRVRLLQAFAQSCDVYYYQVARGLGMRRLLAYLDALELDVTTGVDLPQEREGLVPTMEWYRRRLGTEPPEGNALNLGIGQGEIILTPLQLASFVAAVVTDGQMRRPHVARRAVGAGGEVVWDYGPPQMVHDLELSAERRDLVRGLMEEAVEGERGTGARARVSGWRVGGKTGTAQNPHGEDHALFVGVAPIDRPGIVVLVVIEESGHGGTVAAPVAQKVLEAFLQEDTPPMTGGTAPVSRRPSETRGVPG